MMPRMLSRRSLMGLTGAASMTMLAGRAWSQEKEEEQVSPVEDLMREHGVLARILLLYEHEVGKGQGLEKAIIFNGATLVRRFVEDYHEKLEEQHVFPRFEKAGTMTELVKTLRQQHGAGRRVTDEMVAIMKGDTPIYEAARKRVGELVAAFSRMYRPHFAREDTVLFPAFKELVPEEEYEKLGEQFEEREEELFGEHGFTNIVEQVAKLEQQAGIYDLAQFTPTV